MIFLLNAMLNQSTLSWIIAERWHPLLAATNFTAARDVRDKGALLHLARRIAQRRVPTLAGISAGIGPLGRLSDQKRTVAFNDSR
jgi:hypothetical protein